VKSVTLKEGFREVEFDDLTELLILLKDFPNKVNAGLDRHSNDSGITLQSLIDRCIVHLNNQDTSECFNLALDLQAWLVGELLSRNERLRVEELRGVYEDLLHLLGSVQ